MVVVEVFAQLLRVADGNRRFDDDPGFRGMLATAAIAASTLDVSK